jgi:eukaryotic-like serine/threonine-protein kinase
LEPKQKLGHYEIQSRLGAGGMGEVYLARDTRLNRLVAIKTLLSSFAADEQRLKRFFHEAKVTSSLNHPNIAQLYEIGESEGVRFLALEYIDGPTLGARLQSGPLPLMDFIDLALQSADALDEAHSNGILHRDLKPDNLMINRRGQLKVLDFGLARASVNSKPDADLTQTEALTIPGAVLGTPRYMSPEQVLGHELDARSDLFSLGVVFYKMATAALPFNGQTAAQLTDAILHNTPASPRLLNPSIPPELERILIRSLEKDPSLRYQSASDLRSDLKRLKRDVESGPQPSSLPPAPLTQPQRRSFPWVGLMALSALLLAAFAYFRPSNSPALQPEMTVQSILNSQTSEISPSISPDGTSVAFAWDGEDAKNFDIYVKPIDSGNPIRLTNTPAAESSPLWSPDGKHIAFLRRDRDQLQLMLIPALGGLERVLAQWKLPELSIRQRDDFAWHPNGKSIVYTYKFAEGQKPGLLLLSLEDGTSSQLTTLPPDFLADSSPVFFSEGSKLAFYRKKSMASGTIEVLNLKTSIAISYRIDDSVSGIAIVPGDKELLLTTTSSLKRLSLDSGKVQEVDPILRRAAYPSLSARGNRMVFQQTNTDTNIWHVTLDSPGHAGPPERWIASTYFDNEPRFSSSGQQILFVSNRSGRGSPWIAGRDGRNAQLIPLDGPFVGSPNWSPDGGRMVYDAAFGGASQVMLVSTLGGKPKAVTTDKFENIVPSWSHDGQWIYYCSNRSGR